MSEKNQPLFADFMETSLTVIIFIAVTGALLIGFVGMMVNTGEVGVDAMLGVMVLVFAIAILAIVYNHYRKDLEG